MRPIRSRLAVALSMLLSPSVFAAPPPIEILAAKSDFDVSEAALSPTGEYLALTVPFGDRTGLVTLRMSDLSRVGSMQAGRDAHITDIAWIGPERLVYALGEKVYDLERPLPTGELYAVDVNGENNVPLVGQRAGGVANMEASRLQRRESELIAAVLIEPVKDDPTDIFVQTWKIGSESGLTQVDRLDVRNGRRRKVADIPVPRADFWLDHAQNVRFASGDTVDNATRVYYRADDDADWVLINDEAESGIDMLPLGFSSDDAVAYVEIDSPTGTSAVHAFDPKTLKTREIVRDKHSDPLWTLRSPHDGSPIGVMVGAGQPRAIYFDPDSVDAKLHGSLQNSFPGQIVQMHRASDDGKSGLFTVFGDRNSGEIYAFDFTTKKARFLGASDSRIDPETLGRAQPIAFDARDGLRIHGLLTLPPGSDGKNLPLIVLPHGGPMGISDQFGYDAEVQVLATRGYAVLQPNFRGSGKFGRAFELAGHKQWGRAMQDDVTDATRWAITEGIADPARICIHGSSYGGYAALMGVAREPTLYRCASGNIGVYDLRAMLRVGDAASVKWGVNRLKDIIDVERADLDSPSKLADRIKVPVLLSAGEEDERAPMLHTERMRDALLKAGVPVETKFYEGEGHGYYAVENRVDYYNRLLAFFDRHIGNAASATKTSATD